MKTKRIPDEQITFAYAKVRQLRDENTRLCRGGRSFDCAVGGTDLVVRNAFEALLPILSPALEHGHLLLDAAAREKILAMSASTIDRALRAPRRATGS